jgi:hypothetical protein
MDRESVFIAWDHNGTNVKYLPLTFEGVYVLDVSNLFQFCMVPIYKVGCFQCNFILHGFEFWDVTFNFFWFQFWGEIEISI